jgi:hypothetical protein
MIRLEFIRVKRKFKEWSHQIIVVWKDTYGNEYTMNHNNIFYALSPKTGDIFDIRYKKMVENRIIFPVEFVGVNNNKHLVYDHRQQRLVKKGHEIEKKKIVVSEKDFLGEFYFEGRYCGNEILGSSSNSKYHVFKPNEPKKYKYLFVTNRNNGLRDIFDLEYNDEMKFYFQREMYLHHVNFRNYDDTEHWKISIGEFPVVISNITINTSCYYDQESQIYKKHELIQDLQSFYKIKYPEWKTDKKR